MYCLPVECIVYLISGMSTCWMYCLPVECIVYLWNVLSTCWMYCLPVECIVYLLNVLSTCWMYCLPVECIVYLLNVLSTCWILVSSARWNREPGYSNTFLNYSFSWHFNNCWNHYVLNHLFCNSKVLFLFFA